MSFYYYLIGQDLIKMVNITVLGLNFLSRTTVKQK